MIKKLESFYNEHKGVIGAIAFFALSMLKATMWGYGLGTIGGRMINKGKTDKSKILIGIPVLIGVLGLNHIFAKHEAEIVTPRILEELGDKDEDEN